MTRATLTTLFGMICIGLLVVFWMAFGSDPHAVPFLLVGKPAPDFVMKDLRSGERMTLAQLKGKPTVMNFWASWCGPCRVEHPYLEWGAKQYGQDVNFVGVVFEDSEEQALQFLRENGASYPQLFDERGQISVDYALSGVPETYFIDDQGIILDKFIGPLNPNQLTEWVRKLQARKAKNQAVPSAPTPTNTTQTQP